jgi:hypothetical protein
MTHTTLNIHAAQIIDLVNDTYRNGGATLYLREYEQGEQYVVGDGTLGIKFDAYNDHTLRHICVTDLADSFSTLVKLIHLARYWQSLGYDTVGAWIDGGTLYLDPGNLRADLGDAIVLAKQRGELAIYDIEAGECIDTSK